MKEIETRVLALAYFDAYGSLLTDAQRDLYRDYYAYDLSLSEIAANQNISRAAVEDAIKKATKKFEEYESKLKLVAKKKKLEKLAERGDWEALKEEIHAL